MEVKRESTRVLTAEMDQWWCNDCGIRYTVHLDVEMNDSVSSLSHEKTS